MINNYNLIYLSNIHLFQLLLCCPSSSTIKKCDMNNFFSHGQEVDQSGQKHEQLDTFSAWEYAAGSLSDSVSSEFYIPFTFREGWQWSRNPIHVLKKYFVSML